MNFIALDLELEQPRSRRETPDSKLDLEKIIQVGWCVFNVNSDSTISILLEQQFHVNIGVPLSKFIKKLTGIKDSDIASGTDLKHIHKELIKDVEKFKTNRAIRQWGGGDMQALQTELENETVWTHQEWAKYKWGLGRSGYNVKHLFQSYAIANNIKHSGGLKKSLHKMGLKFEGKAHNALTDAINTARIYGVLHNKLKD